MAENDGEHHFIFDLDKGIGAQVVQKLESSPLLHLTRGAGPPSSGIYALYYKRSLVYVGKASRGTTKSKRTLRARLSEHAAKIAGRKNISLDDMRCRYLTLESEWWVFAAEFVCHEPIATDVDSLVPSTGTKPELLVSALVHGMGFRYWLHDRRPPRDPGPGISAISDTQVLTGGGPR